MKNYYEILGISRNAPQEVVIGAYQALALKLDPLKGDVNNAPDSPSFSDVVEAFSVLSSPDKRRHYDFALDSKIAGEADESKSDMAIKEQLQNLKTAWEIAIQFDRSETLSRDYQRLSSLDSKLGEDFQRLILEKKLLESPADHVEALIQRYYTQEFGPVSIWMRLFIDGIYSSNKKGAAVELKTTIRVMGTAVDEFEIMEIVAAKHQLGPLFADIASKRAEYDEEEQRKEKHRREEQLREEQLREEQRQEEQLKEEQLQKKLESERLSSHARQASLYQAALEKSKREQTENLKSLKAQIFRRRMLMIAIGAAIVALFFMKAGIKKNQSETHSAQIQVPSQSECDIRYKYEPDLMLCSVYWKNSDTSCSAEIRRQILERGLDIGSAACRDAVACSGADCTPVKSTEIQVSTKGGNGLAVSQSNVRTEPELPSVSRLSPIVFQLQGSLPLKCETSSNTDDLPSEFAPKRRFEFISTAKSMYVDLYSSEFLKVQYTSDDSAGAANFSLQNGTVLRIKPEGDFYLLEIDRYDKSGKHVAKAFCG